MPSFAQVRDAAIAALKQSLPKGTRCEPFEGGLNPESVALKRLSRSGAVLVTCIGAVNTSEADTLDCTMQLALGAFCISQSAAGAAGREADALPLAQTVSRLVHGSSFDLAGVTPGRLLGVENQFTVELEKQSITAWAVTWEHHIVFE